MYELVNEAEYNSAQGSYNNYVMHCRGEGVWQNITVRCIGGRGIGQHYLTFFQKSSFTFNFIQTVIINTIF